MKKKIMALVLVAALAISAMSMLAVQAAGIEVTVDGAEFTVTVSGETDELDWVGIYKEENNTARAKAPLSRLFGGISTILQKRLTGRRTRPLRIHRSAKAEIPQATELRSSIRILC